MAELSAMGLKEMHKNLNQECSLQRRALEHELENIYNAHPSLRSKVKPKALQSPKGVVPCSDERFSTCEAVIYDYLNGNRRIVQELWARK